MIKRKHRTKEWKEKKKDGNEWKKSNEATIERKGKMTIRILEKERKKERKKYYKKVCEWDWVKVWM